MSVAISIQVCSHIPCIFHTIIQCLSLYGKDDWIDKHVWHFTHIGQIKPSIPFLFVFSHWCFVPGHKGKFYIRRLVSWGWDISQSITSIVCESVTNKTLSSTIRLWYASRNNVWAALRGDQQTNLFRACATKRWTTQHWQASNIIWTDQSIYDTECKTVTNNDKEHLRRSLYLVGEPFW